MLDGKLIWTGTQPKHWIDEVLIEEFSGRNIVLAASRDDRVYMWDMGGNLRWEKLQSEPGVFKRIVNTLIGLTGGKDVHMSVGEFKGQKVIISGSDDLYISDENGKQLWDSQESIKFVEDITFGKLNGRKVIICGCEEHPTGGNIFVWDVNGKLMWKGEKMNYPIKSVNIGRLDGREVVVAGGGDNLQKEIAKESYHFGEDVIVETKTQSFGGGLQVYDKEGEPLWAGSKLKEIKGWVEHTIIEAIDGKDVILVGVGRENWKRDDGGVYVLNNKGEIILEYKEPMDWIWKVGSADLAGKDCIIAVCGDSTLFVFDLEGDTIWKSNEAEAGVNDFVLREFHGEKYIIVSSADHHVYIWNEQGELVWKGTGPTKSLFCVDAKVIGDKMYVVAGSLDSDVYVWELKGD
ncbi:MAG: WD40 repeat domain-containing protein [Thermoplasmata archaeon]